MPFSLKRWSQKKLDAARAAPEPAVPPAPAPAPAQPSAAGAVECVPAGGDAPPLPPVESLNIDSDFRAFLQPKVEEGLRRRALRQLFRDPHFNVMDGLDVYIDDYSKPDPISAEIVRGLVQARYIFDPPQTRVNDGVAEDVPPCLVAADPGAAKTAALPDVTPSEASAPLPNPASSEAADTVPASASPSPGADPASR